MNKILTKLHSILNELKGFTAGISSAHSDRMYINYEGKHYMLKLVELDPEEVTDKDRIKYQNSDDETILGFKYIDKLKYYD